MPSPLRLTRLFWIAPIMLGMGIFVRYTGAAEEQAPAPTLVPTSAPRLLASEVPAAIPTAAEPAAVVQAPASLPTPTQEIVLSHVSYYWPPLGDINCDYECEHVANGDEFLDWVGKGLACPTIYPLGTLFLINGDEWVCVDRGEAIVVNKDGSIWLDFLTPTMPYDLVWGSLQTVEVLRPAP